MKKTYEVTAPFIGYCSVLIEADSPEKAMAEVMRKPTAELMNDSNGGGIGELHFRLSVESGEMTFCVAAEEVPE